jgi:hypothetical protein
MYDLKVLSDTARYTDKLKSDLICVLFVNYGRNGFIKLTPDRLRVSCDRRLRSRGLAATRRAILRQGCQMHIKIPIWVNFGRPWNGKCCYILRPFGSFYSLWYMYVYFGQLVFFIIVWYIFYIRQIL